jgi:hypothetical protein
MNRMVHGGDRETSEDYREAGYSDRDSKKNGGAVRNKVKAVETLKQEGYTVRDGCSALGISRSGYYVSCIHTSWTQKYTQIVNLNANLDKDIINYLL